ncbi:MAG: hypothetical protein J6Y91_06320 [Alphaproteobacteria bacterium]|nr:hypothetical protein [Alphaproteobacteria bacterium]
MIEENALLPLIDRRHLALFQDYMRYLRLSEKQFFNPAIETGLKAEKLRLLDRAVRRDFPLKNNFLARLQHAFVRENLSLYLLLDVLQGWRYYAAEKKLPNEKRFTEICGYVFAPLARLLMVLHNEGPSTYQPMTALLVSLYLMQLSENETQKVMNSKISKRNKLNKFRGLYNDSKVILQIINSKKLKFRLAKLLNLQRLKIEKMEKNKQLTIGTLDAMRIFLYSVIQFLCVKKRTICKKGI